MSFLAQRGRESGPNQAGLYPDPFYFLARQPEFSIKAFTFLLNLRLRWQITQHTPPASQDAYNRCLGRPHSVILAGCSAGKRDATLETVPIESVRRSFAEELCRRNGISSPAILAAFSTVPRERFAGPSPWMIQASGTQSFTETADPSDLYRDALIVLDPNKRLNNGQPSLWAIHLSLLDVHPGDTVLHLGCGTGYYTAILAELVGPHGRVIAVEIDHALAARARIALEPWPQVTVVHADGARGPFDPADSDRRQRRRHASTSCVARRTQPEGKLLFPLTPARGPGAMAYLTRKGADLFAATLCGSVFFVDFEGARDTAIGNELAHALKRDRGSSVRSLRCDAHERDNSCWMHGNGCCFSRRMPSASLAG